MKKQILLEDLEAIKRMKSGPRDAGKPMFTTKVTKKLPDEVEADPKDDSEGEIDADQRDDIYVDADGIHRLH